MFEACARERQPEATPADIARSREKAFRAPSLLLAAHGLGYGAMLTSGHAVRTARFAQAFALGADEQAVCFISIGTATAKAKLRNPRASAHELMSDWQA